MFLIRDAFHAGRHTYYRVSRRLGLVDIGVSVDEAHDVLEAQICLLYTSEAADDTLV